MPRSKTLSPKSDRKPPYKNKVREAQLMGMAAGITFLICLTQYLILKNFLPSIALKSDTIHTFSDALVIFGGFLVAVIAISASKARGEKYRRFFSWIGVIVLALGAANVLSEAHDRLSTPIHFENGWLILIGLIGGLGNYWVHTIIARVPSEDHHAMHRVLDMHIVSDMILSGIVVLAGLFAILFSWDHADPIFSHIAAGWMLWVASRLALVLLGILQDDHPCSHHH